LVEFAKGEMASFTYAVRRGRRPGLYNTWAECKQQVDGFPAAEFKKFPSVMEARAFLNGGDDQVGNNNNQLPVGRAHVQIQPNFQDQPIHRTGYAVVIPASANLGISVPSKPMGSSIKRSKDPIVIYIDGSSLNNGQPNARAGYGVYFGPQDSRNVSAPLRDGAQTNQRAELMAAITALRSVDESAHVQLKSDSHYVIKGMTEWVKTWKGKQWQVSVTNIDLFRWLDQLVQSRQGETEFLYVPAHSGVLGNECADALAKKGAQMQ
jgi:ribonuclease HI